jgi:hypothetical protein
MHPTRQAIDKITLNRPDRQIIPRCTQAWPIIQCPANFAAREIRIEQQAGLRLNNCLLPVGFEYAYLLMFERDDSV